jgi:hypothetical protein
VTRRSARTRPKNVREFRREGIGLRTQPRSLPAEKEDATPDIEGALAFLREENAELRARAVELILQIRALRK